MSIMEIFEIITLVTGVIYVILEILQKNSMWILGVVTSLGSVVVYGIVFGRSLAPGAEQPGNGLLMLLLYTYYTAISFYGLYKWKFYKHHAQEDSGADPDSDVIVMNHLRKKELTLGIALFVAGTVLVPEFLKGLGLWSETLSSWLSTVNVVLSALGTYWLTKAYIQQWGIWVLANAAWLGYNICEGLWWMSALSAVYIISAVYGYIHWKRNGHYID